MELQIKKQYVRKRNLLVHSKDGKQHLQSVRNSHTVFPTASGGANFLPKDRREKILKLLAEANESELLLIHSMLGKMERPEQVMHFFLGAHIELRGDNAEHYKKWKTDFGKNKLATLKNRISSHKSVDQQHAISGHVVSEALFGTRLINKNKPSAGKYTWIQLESHPVGGLKAWTKGPKAFVKELKNLFLHMVSYFDYKWNKNNIGPYGKSAFTEKNPLVIDVSQLTPEKEAANRALWIETFIAQPGVATPQLVERMQTLNRREIHLNI